MTLLRMTDVIVFGQLPISLILGANQDWSFDVLDILVPHKHIHAVASWFEKAGLRKVDGTYLTSANGDVRLTTLPPDLGRTDAADVFANTCDQTFFSQSGLTIAYPLPTYENLNLCLSTDPMQLFGDTDHRCIWSENGFPLLKLGGHLCSAQPFSPASLPDSIQLPEILPLHVLGLSFEPDTHV